MNYSLIRQSDASNGPGLRLSLFVSGCQKALEGNACPGCFNQITWDKDAGKLWTPEIQEHVLESIEPSYISGLSILGGEPLSDFNLQPVKDLVEACKKRHPEKDIWLWTGYTISEIQNDVKKKDIFFQMVQYLDYIVDGPFIQNLSVPNLKHRGSTNQRIFKIHHINESHSIEDITGTIQNASKN